MDISKMSPYWQSVLPECSRITLWEYMIVQQEISVSNQDKLLLSMHVTQMGKQKHLFCLYRIDISVSKSTSCACVVVICLNFRQISPIVLSQIPRVSSEHSGSTDCTLLNQNWENIDRSPIKGGSNLVNTGVKSQSFYP